jgi:hypothetical protein
MPPSIAIPDPEPKDVVPDLAPDFFDDPDIVDDIAPAAPRYKLRPDRNRKYAHRLDHIMDHPPDNKSYDTPTQFLQHSTKRVLTAYVLTQMSAAKGIKFYGKPAVDAIFKKFTQLHDKGVFDPQDASKLTYAQKMVLFVLST